MHNVPELIFIFLFCLLAYFVWGRDLDEESALTKRNREAGAGEVRTNRPTSAAQEQATDVFADCVHDRNAPVDVFSCDFGQQIRQVIALNAAIRQVQSNYSASCQRLQLERNNPQCVIIDEQMRIAASYAAEVSRYAFSWVSDKSFYRPTFAQASWAFTAAHLSLSFAGARVLNLSAT
ncbi:MAG: hypothetical protein KGS72_04060 [Cyanobacteria bacterium REEB67]|nr:hypothetical protein [Cyanobacteria bacterium REEB67]